MDRRLLYHPIIAPSQTTPSRPSTWAQVLRTLLSLWPCSIVFCIAMSNTNIHWVSYSRPALTGTPNSSHPLRRMLHPPWHGKPRYTASSSSSILVPPSSCESRTCFITRSASWGSPVWYLLHCSSFLKEVFPRSGLAPSTSIHTFYLLYTIVISLQFFFSQ